MKRLIMVKDLFSFVFLRNPNALVGDFLKRETTEEILTIDWRRATWNGVGWPRMEVHNQLQMKEMKRKRKAYWMYWIILLCSQPRDWMGCVIRLSSRSKCVIRSALDHRHLEIYTRAEPIYCLKTVLWKTESSGGKSSDSWWNNAYLHRLPKNLIVALP